MPFSDTPDLFAPRPAPAVAPVQAGCSRCGSDGRELPAVCFLSELAFQAYLLDNARAREAAEIGVLLNASAGAAARWIERVRAKRGAAAANRLETGLQLAQLKRGEP
ncbi:MAG TPA: hypothetical protein VFA75_10010 [Nevskia sp.]|nr:hypothetical protein [Nevskia sp.]